MDKNIVFECFYTRTTKAIEKISKQGIKGYLCHFFLERQ